MNVSKTDLFWQITSIVLSFAINFLLLPFLIYFLTSAELGLWYVFLSIYTLVTLLDFGFNPSLSRNISYAYSGASNLQVKGYIETDENSPNLPLLKSITSATKKLYAIISFLSLISLITVGTFYIYSITKNENITLVYISWFVFIIAVVFNLFFNYISVFLRGLGRIKDLNKSMVYSRIIQFIITLLLLFFGFGILGATIGWFIYGLSFRVFGLRKLKQSDTFSLIKTINDNKIDALKILKIIFPMSWREAVISLSKYITNQATTLILPIFLTLQETSRYSLAMQLATAIATISGATYVAYQPSIQFYNVKGDKQKVKEFISFSIINYISFYLIGSVLLITIGVPILILIRNDFDFQANIFLIVSIYIFITFFHNYFASIISNKNELPFVKSYVISSFIGLGLSLLYMTYFNATIVGVVLITIIIQLAYNFWKWPIYALKIYDLKVIEILKYYFLRLKAIIRRNS